MATFADILDIEVESDGISFLPELLGDEQKQTHDYLYWEFPENDGSIAVRMGEWKGIIENVHKGNEVMKLYNLNSDPRELFDVSHQNPLITEKIKQLITVAHSPSVIEKFKFPFDKQHNQQ